MCLLKQLCSALPSVPTDEDRMLHFKEHWSNPQRHILWSATSSGPSEGCIAFFSFLVMLCIWWISLQENPTLKLKSYVQSPPAASGVWCEYFVFVNGFDIAGDQATAHGPSVRALGQVAGRDFDCWELVPDQDLQMEHVLHLQLSLACIPSVIIWPCFWVLSHWKKRCRTSIGRRRGSWGGGELREVLFCSECGERVGAWSEAEKMKINWSPQERALGLRE